MEKELIGYQIEKLIYRGQNIFTVVVEKEGNKKSLNFIDTIALDDIGVVGKVITKFSCARLGSKHIFICQKFNLNPLEYKSFWIRVKNKANEECELIVASKRLDISADIDLYNPVSEDKYKYPFR